MGWDLPEPNKVRSLRVDKMPTTVLESTEQGFHEGEGVEMELRNWLHTGGLIKKYNYIKDQGFTLS